LVVRAPRIGHAAPRPAGTRASASQQAYHGGDGHFAYAFGGYGRFAYAYGGYGRFDYASPVTRSSGPLLLWPRIAYSAFFAVWLPAYWLYYGPQNLLWLCNTANFLILAGLWRQSRLLMSWQAVGLLAVEAGWIADFAARLALGFHPVGGTEYMFDATIPLGIRFLSLYHAALPPLLLWSVRRLGYDRRAFWWQCGLTWLLLPISYFCFPERNLNMVHAPFHRPLVAVPAHAWFAACFALYPLVLYWPVHLLLARWFGAPRCTRP
jgi:hypothetical protein